MKFSLDSEIFKGAYLISPMGGFATLPWLYTDPRTEYLACRNTAWLGTMLNMTPVYDIYGPDAAKFFNMTCVNRDFSVMKNGQSKHALMCNEKGQLLADGVVMKMEGDLYRTYWMAPAIQYFLEKSGLDVKGEYREDEYFFQIDGPKSLEILEEATQTDLHDIKFARNKTVKICGTDMVVHRLGMSGALAYEVHGHSSNAEIVYKKLREVVEQFGGQPLGAMTYSIVNHTPGGYPNQLQHYAFPLLFGDSDLAEFAKKCCMLQPFRGSAMNDPEAYFVTPYDIGWGYLVNFDHDFMGKEALEKINAEGNSLVPVTLEWNENDIGDVFMSQFRGTGEVPFGRLESPTHTDVLSGFGVHVDYVLADNKKIGRSSGRTYAYFEQHMISLGFIEKEYAELGRELTVLWGEPGTRQKEVRVKVAPFPYYNGEFRNETFDTEKIPHRTFE